MNYKSKASKNPKYRKWQKIMYQSFLVPLPNVWWTSCECTKRFTIPLAFISYLIHGLLYAQNLPWPQTGNSLGQLEPAQMSKRENFIWKYKCTSKSSLQEYLESLVKQTLGESSGDQNARILYQARKTNP